MPRRPIMTLSVLFAAACSGGIDRSAIGEAYVSAECSQLLGCCSATPGAPTEAQCEAAFLEQIVPGFATLQASAEVDYDSGKGQACIESLRTAGCEAAAYGGASDSCATMFTGKIALGGACQHGYECQSRLCAGISSGSSGTCAAPGEAGQPCSSGAIDGVICVVGTRADDQPSGCICHALAADGASCEDATGCASSYCASSVCAPMPANTSLDSESCQELYANEGG